MRNTTWLAAAALALSVAGCAGYPTTSYGGYPSGYGYSNGYYAQPTYYQQPAYYQPVQTRYVPVPAAQSAPPPYRMRDRDHDGVPDRFERDRNGDGIPDHLQHN
jgi:hypothetical protein